MTVLARYAQGYHGISVMGITACLLTGSDGLGFIVLGVNLPLFFFLNGHSNKLPSTHID